MTDRLERLINLVIALRETRRPMTAEDVRERVAGYGQAEHEAFRRMFERDKSDLRALGVPVETAPLDVWQDQHGYRIPADRYDLPPVELSPGELAALALALQATGFFDEGAPALLKLGVDAGQPHRPDDAGAPLGVVVDGPHLVTLTEAQLTRTAVRFTYQPAQGPTAQRTVDPHALVHRGGHWYLVGRDHARDERRAFRLDRIAGGVAAVGEPGAFPAPPDSGIDDVVPPVPADAPETAEVSASPDAAWQVARRARGAGTPAEDGWTWFTVTVGDPDRFLGWALEFGPDLEVLGPPRLREEAVARLRAVAGRLA